MAIPVFKPRTESDLLAWSSNFVQRVSFAPMAVGLSVPQVAHYQSLHADFASWYTAANTPHTNSQAAIIAKNAAKKRLLNSSGGAWELVRIVQAFPGMTNTMRGELGLRLPAPPQRVGPPTSAPVLAIVYTTGRIIKVRLRDQESSTRRGKPDGVIGATILLSVGERPPSSRSAWRFARNTSKAVTEVIAPADLPVGAEIWLTAFWFNARMQSSAPATPQSTRIADGLALAA